MRQLAGNVIHQRSHNSSRSPKSPASMSRQPHNSNCPGPINRRTWLKLGGLSLGALAGGAVPGLARVLAAQGSNPAADKDFSVILFWANGGPSHLDLFDLKPEAPAEYRGPFAPIATRVPGMEITEQLPNLAKLGDKISIIRSLHHQRAEHSGGTNRFLTGYASVAANLASSEFPQIGSVVAKHLSETQRDIPLFMGNTPFYGGGPAYLGPAYAPYMPRPNSITRSGNNRYDPVPIYTAGAPDSTLSVDEAGARKLRRRRDLVRSFDRLRSDIDASGKMAAVDSFNQLALNMLSSSRTRDAFDLSQETLQTRARYGDTHWGNSLLTCRRLVEAGVRFVQCQAGYRLKPETGRTSNWDDHSVNAHIFDAYREKLPQFDQAVPALIEDLSQRGLDKNVLFVFCGEFGRTPKILHQDASGRPGRDHWPQAMSVLLAGGGLKMGQVIGATNRLAEHPTQRAMNSNCLLATIYHRFGIDSAHVHHDHSGRPIPVLTDGKPIAELV